MKSKSSFILVLGTTMALTVLTRASFAMEATVAGHRTGANAPHIASNPFRSGVR